MRLENIHCFCSLQEARERLAEVLTEKQNGFGVRSVVEWLLRGRQPRLQLPLPDPKITRRILSGLQSFDDFYAYTADVATRQE